MAVAVDEKMTKLIQLFACFVILGMINLLVVILRSSMDVSYRMQVLVGQATSSQFPSNFPLSHHDADLEVRSAGHYTNTTVSTVNSSLRQGQVSVTKTATNPCTVEDRAWNITRALLHLMNPSQDDDSWKQYNCLHPNETYCAHYFRPRLTRTPFPYGYMIENKNRCKPDTDIIVVIHSKNTFFEQRKVGRDTWLKAISIGIWPNAKRTFKHLVRRVQYLFIIGQSKDPSVNEKLKEENDKYQDLVVGNFVDHYYNLSVKSLLSFKWVLANCACVKLFMKCDDDIFINFPLLLDNALLKPMNWSGKMLGKLWPRSWSQRDGKAALSMDEYPFEVLPRFVAGGTYIMDRSLLASFASLSEYVPLFSHGLEDLYISGIMGKILGVEHFEKANFRKAVLYKCDIAQNKTFTALTYNQKVIRQVWSELRQTRDCQSPKKALPILHTKQNLKPLKLQNRQGLSKHNRQDRQGMRKHKALHTNHATEQRKDAGKERARQVEMLIQKMIKLKISKRPSK